MALKESFPEEDFAIRYSYLIWVCLSKVFARNYKSEDNIKTIKDGSEQIYRHFQTSQNIYEISKQDIIALRSKPIGLFAVVVVSHVFLAPARGLANLTWFRIAHTIFWAVQLSYDQSGGRGGVKKWAIFVVKRCLRNSRMQTKVFKIFLKRFNNL